MNDTGRLSRGRPARHGSWLPAAAGMPDSVSGATVTSGGYLESLQAALDAAHFG